MDVNAEDTMTDLALEVRLELVDAIQKMPPPLSEPFVICSSTLKGISYPEWQDSFHFELIVDPVGTEYSFYSWFSVASRFRRSEKGMYTGEVEFHTH